MKLESEMEECLKSLKERCKRTVLRKIDAGEVTYDAAKKIFVYKDTEEEYKAGEKRNGEADDSEEDDDEDESDSDNDETGDNKEKIKSSIK